MIMGDSMKNTKHFSQSFKISAQILIIKMVNVTLESIQYKQLTDLLKILKNWVRKQKQF